MTINTGNLVSHTSGSAPHIVVPTSPTSTDTYHPAIILVPFYANEHYLHRPPFFSSGLAKGLAIGALAVGAVFGLYALGVFGPVVAGASLFSAIFSTASTTGLASSLGTAALLGKIALGIGALSAVVGGVFDNIKVRNDYNHAKLAAYAEHQRVREHEYARAPDLETESTKSFSSAEAKRRAASTGQSHHHG